MGILAVLRGLVRELGPYLIIELLLPGGSLLALLLFLYRRRQAATATGASSTQFPPKRALTDRINAHRLGFAPR